MDALIETVLEFWFALCTMAPYLLFGFLMAGGLSVVISPRFIEAHLGGGLLSVVKAAVLGVPLPLCSCGVIPVGASLRRHGASSAATTSFLISTPQTGIDSLLVTYSMLGGVIAVFRPVAAFVSGVVGGALVHFCGTGRAEKPEALDSTPDACSIEGHSNRFIKMFRYGFITLPADIGRSLLVGLLIAGAITVFAPPDVFGNIFGKGFGAMLAMLAVGVPFYVCATASVPVAMAMIAHQGVSPGAALVFLMTGPATNAATITTIWRIMGRRAAVIYLLAVMGTALASGLILDGFFDTAANVVAGDHDHASARGIGWAATASGVVLVIILLPSLIGPVVARWRRKEPQVSETETVTLSITGMTCSHCAASVQRALAECDGVKQVSVDLSAGRAAIGGDGLDTDALVAAVASLGYSAESLS